jgi:hypothetical protein
MFRFRAKRGQLQGFDWKPRPESGLEYLICAGSLDRGYRGQRSLPIVVWCLVCRLDSAQLTSAYDMCGFLALCLVRSRAKGGSASEQRGNNFKGFKDVYLETETLTVLCVPSSLVSGSPRAQALAPAEISFGRVFVINTWAHLKLLHTWTIATIVKQHLVQIG